MIKIVIKDSNALVVEGIKSMLASVEDICVTDAFKSAEELTRRIKLAEPNVVLYVSYFSNDDEIAEIKKIINSYRKAKLLVVSFNTQESFIIRSIKEGAKGFLSQQAKRSDLVEAIYSLRGGFDYYGKRISNLLMNTYLNNSYDNTKTSEAFGLLTEREIEVLKLFAESHTNGEIADKLFISVRTVESHKNNIMHKAHLRNTVDLIKFALKNNLTKI